MKNDLNTNTNTNSQQIHLELLRMQWSECPKYKYKFTTNTLTTLTMQWSEYVDDESGWTLLTFTFFNILQKIFFDNVGKHIVVNIKSKTRSWKSFKSARTNAVRGLQV